MKASTSCYRYAQWSSTSAEDEKQRIYRVDGLGTQVAKLCDEICSDITTARGLTSRTLTMQDVTLFAPRSSSETKEISSLATHCFCVASDLELSRGKSSASSHVVHNPAAQQNCSTPQWDRCMWRFSSSLKTVGLSKLPRFALAPLVSELPTLR